jgi:hypothetical protein
MSRVLANLFIVQRTKSPGDIMSSANIGAIIAPNRNLAQKKFLLLHSKTTTYSGFKYYRYWVSMKVEDYENHRDRRRSWGL